MLYKCSSDSIRQQIINEFSCNEDYESDDYNILLFPLRSHSSTHELNEEEANKISRYLGALHSEIELKTSTLINILKNIFVSIRRYNISELIESEDVDRLLEISQNEKYTSMVKELTNFIISIMLTYPQEISHKLYENGIFQQMIANFLEPQWMYGIIRYCSFSIENRDQIFQLNLPQELCNQLDTNLDQCYKILDGIANFAMALCSFPLSDDNQFDILSHLFNVLVRTLSKAKIDEENIILSALFKFSILDPNCLNEFSKYHIFAYYSSRSESFNQRNIRNLAILMIAVMNYSLDYADYLTTNENCWEIVLRYFITLAETKSDLYVKSTIIISDAAIIMANICPSIFIDRSIYVHFLDLYERFQYEIKSQICMCFYSVFERATQSQIKKLIENENYRLILCDYFPDINHSKFILGAKGFLNIMNYLEMNQKYAIISDLLQSEELESFFLKCYEDHEIINSISEEKRDILLLVISKISQHKDKIE